MSQRMLDDSGVAELCCCFALCVRLVYTIGIHEERVFGAVCHRRILIAHVNERSVCG